MEMTGDMGSAGIMPEAAGFGMRTGIGLGGFGTVLSDTIRERSRQQITLRGAAGVKELREPCKFPRKRSRRRQNAHLHCAENNAKPESGVSNLRRATGVRFFFHAEADFSHGARNVLRLFGGASNCDFRSEKPRFERRFHPQYALTKMLLISNPTP